ncbi:MAG: hypothetical protein ACFFBX_08120, partial [Promethearchaeota archaeon]
PGGDMLITQFIEQLFLYLNLSWGVIILIGDLIAMFLIALGFISWLTDWQPIRGKRMIIGGILLFLIIQWMAISSPLMLIY